MKAWLTTLCLLTFAARICGALPPPTLLAQADFKSADIPMGWVEKGSPWQMGNGAGAPVRGGYDTILSYRGAGNGASTLDESTITVRIKLADPHSVFALCTQGKYGTIGELDGAENVLRFYRSWAGEADPVSLGTVKIPYPLNAGATLQLSLSKSLVQLGNSTKHAYCLTLRDEATGKTVSYQAYFEGGIIPWPGHMWGAPGVMFRRGKLTILDFRWTTPFPDHPRLWIGGDSFVEGDSIFANKDRRFAQQLYTKLNGSVVISGGGGDTSADLLARLSLDLTPFRPTYCLVLIGANDRDFSTWSGNLQKILAGVTAQGARPILGTLAPRADRQAFINHANAWIRASGVRYVDFAAALTSNRDGVTWNPTLARSDGVHPNLLGHDAMVAQILADIPDLVATQP